MYGEVLSIDESGVRVALNGGSLLVRRMRREGERPAAAAEVAAALGLEVGERLGIQPIA